jgi:Leucine-rich repeat (LRR) protein
MNRQNKSKVVRTKGATVALRLLPGVYGIQSLALVVLVLAGLMTAGLAQEVSIPDPGLNAAIREALQKPNGPLTEQDLLSLTNLDASSRNISNVEGLEAARNLSALYLSNNELTNFTLPDG